VQIILISDRLAKARSVTIAPRHVFASLVVALLLLTALTGAVYWTTLHFASQLKIPFVEKLVASAQRAEAEKARQYVQQNVNAMAVRLGEMQAQLARLDALGERLSSLGGIKPKEIHLGGPPGLGGAVSTMPPQNLSISDLESRVALLSRQMENRSDFYGVLDSELRDLVVRRKVMPTMLPVHAARGSGFGKRIDPFTGQLAMHEGIDFEVDSGTPVLAAAGGVVHFAGHHPQYGNLVEIDHGNELSTRYAHLSKVLVRTGEIVMRGREVGVSGSTGRATGPHLHFEVRYKGVALNPDRFLKAVDPTLPEVRQRRVARARD